MEMLAELAEDDKNFQSKFNKLFDNPDIKEVDKELTPDLYDNYANMELKLDLGGDMP